MIKLRKSLFSLIKGKLNLEQGTLWSKIGYVKRHRNKITTDFILFGLFLKNTHEVESAEKKRVIGKHHYTRRFTGN